MNIFITTKLFLILSLFTINALYANDHISFDESMLLNQFPNAKKSAGNQSFYTFFKNLYEKNCLKNVTINATPRIPKIIHQLWLGSPFPEIYRGYQQSWIQFHPDWEFRLWTDADMPQVFADYKKLVGVEHLDLQDFYEKSNNYGERADIIRYMILYLVGGVFVDIDAECLRRFDIFHHAYDLYLGVQPLDTNSVQLGLAIFGSIPQHPVMRHTLDTLKDDQHRPQIVVKTGPIHFLKSFYQCADRNNTIDIAFPASFFYPCGYEQRGRPASEWQKPESYAVHHWAGSWLKPSAMVH